MLTGEERAIRVLVEGKPITDLPHDLFIPPDALEVLLDSFTGPLDLLLYLIRKQNLDILNIPISLITEQYLQYIQLLEAKRLELAADYLVMAAMLAEIKSRMLLPISPHLQAEEEEDPRLVLVRRLQEYEKYKNAAQTLDDLPRLERDNFNLSIVKGVEKMAKILPSVNVEMLVHAWEGIIAERKLYLSHTITAEQWTVRERMITVLEIIEKKKCVAFTDLLQAQEARIGVVISFLAILELARQALVHLIQLTPDSGLFIQARSHGD